MLKLKESVDFSELEQYGFEEDPSNCDDAGDHYYRLNDHFYQSSNGEFRIDINMFTRTISILCLAKERRLHNTDDLEPLFRLINNGLVEIKIKEGIKING